MILLMAIGTWTAGLAACSDAAEREEAEMELKQRLEKIDQQISELKARATELKQEARDRLTKTLKDLDAQRQVVEERLRNMKDASKDSWSRFKDDAKSAMDNLGEAVKKTWEELKR
jgi:septal ring factor EnvC (AmiA/AmiB activator)